MRIEIIDVGDGACSVASDCFSPADLTMVDCGRRRNGGRAAANSAKKYLGDRVGDITTLVVTHFDQDHWDGLLRLATEHKNLRPGPRKPVEIRIPGLPTSFAKELRAGMLALVSRRDSAPVNALELLDTWKRAGINVRQTVHYAGDRFNANGREWKVLWPPRSIPSEMGTRIEKWLKKLAELAIDMEASGDTRLRENLREAYVQVERFNEVSPANEETPKAPVWPERPSAHHEEHPRGTHSNLKPLKTSPVEVESATRSDEFADIPKAFKERFSHLVESMSFIDNALSMVVATEGGDFVSFGDIEGSALDGLRSNPDLEKEYAVMLAPHHGTHEAPPWFPNAHLCISQNGSEHSDHNSNHRDTHACSGCCMSTFELGSICIEMPCCNVTGALRVRVG